MYKACTLPTCMIQQAQEEGPRERGANVNQSVFASIGSEAIIVVGKSSFVVVVVAIWQIIIGVRNKKKYTRQEEETFFAQTKIGVKIIPQNEGRGEKTARRCWQLVAFGRARGFISQLFVLTLRPILKSRQSIGRSRCGLGDAQKCKDIGCNSYFMVTYVNTLPFFSKIFCCQALF